MVLLMVIYHGQSIPSWELTYPKIQGIFQDDSPFLQVGWDMFPRSLESLRTM